MSQDYDKIIKENIEEIILPLAHKILQIEWEALEEIPDDLQRTIERKPDFLKKVIQRESEKDFILHIEFQKEDSQEMVYRMLEYFALLMRKYKMEIRQYVFYIDEGKPTMPTNLTFDNLNYHFELLGMQDFNYHQFLESDIPEEIILSVLADFGNESPRNVLTQIIGKIKSLEVETFRKEKCVQQLEILSNLRNLQAVTFEILNLMALTYNLETDIRFQQGKEIGEELGKKENRFEIAKKMKEEGLEPTLIARITGLSLEEINALS